MKKVILITGASSGMGKVTAIQLIKAGHIVYGAARRLKKMQDLVDAGGHVIAMDVTDERQVVAGVKQIVEEQGRIDVLVNNAGYAVYGSVEDVSMENARRQFDVNIFGLAQITREVLPHMRAQKSGKIINISSVGGKIYTPLGAWYHATKHALEGWSDCLRIEVQQFGIDVVIVEPGAIVTEFGDVMTQPMLDRSKGGAYEKMATTIASSTDKFYDNSPSTSPTIIANIIAKAIDSKRPKTRYAGGKMAKPMLFLRRWLSDRMFDKMLFSQLK